MPSDATNAATKEEWRELGFFYESNESSKQWRLVGSKSGLSKFVELLQEYAADPRNRVDGEHEHYGPYMYLEVMTSDRPGMDGHSIHGSIDDLSHLASLIQTKLEESTPGDALSIKDEYSPKSEYALVLEVREEGFDPADADDQLK